jgi:hypothetical protein
MLDRPGRVERLPRTRAEAPDTGQVAGMTALDAVLDTIGALTRVGAEAAGLGQPWCDSADDRHLEPVEDPNRAEADDDAPVEA